MDGNNPWQLSAVFIFLGGKYYNKEIQLLEWLTVG
jgi:hypothetical protein